MNKENISRYKYDLVVTGELEQLIEAVNKVVKLKYKPIGGIIYADGFYIQAVAYKGKTKGKS